MSTEVHRQEEKSTRRDPRVTVLVFDRNDMWSWVETRGEVVEMVTGQVARDHIDGLANKYLGVGEYPNPIQSERVIVEIAPSRQLVR